MKHSGPHLFRTNKSAIDPNEKVSDAIKIRTISPHDALTAHSTGRTSQAFDLTTPRFAGQPSALRAKGWPRRRAILTLDGRLPNHANEPVYGIPAIGILRTEVSSRKYDLSVLRRPRAGDALRAPAMRVW
jgi:hypothetical protein